MDQPQAFKELTLENLNGGAVKELFEEELKKVLVNINDINVEADFAREILIKVKIKPSKDRRAAITSVQAMSKLAPVCANQGSMFLAFNGNKPIAYANDYRQTEINFQKQQKTEGEE